MRLTIKLVVWFFACALLAIGVNAVFAVRTELGRYEADLGERHAVMGRVLRAAFGTVMEKEGEARAVSVLDYTDKRVRRVDIRWVHLEPNAPLAQRPRIDPSLLEPLRLGEDVHREQAGHLFSYVAVRIEGKPLTALEFGEALDGERSVVRRAVFTELRAVGAMALAIGIVAAIVGALLVARPMRRLVEHARRIGRGDLSPATLDGAGDEIGQLAQEMNAMCVQLSEAEDAKVRALEQLRHAERLSTVGALASGLAHELGTPLNVISLRAKAIAQGRSVNEQAREAATSIEQQAMRVTKLVRQLLDFARRKSPAPAEVAVVDVCTRAADLVATVATRTEVTIETELDHDLSIRGDSVQLEQVLLNILLNAVQASPPGERVILRAEAAESAVPPAYVHGAGRRYVRLAVRDHGAGIAPDVLPHVFEPFYTTKDVGEGTGLGLAVCYGITRDHGGWIDVTSSSGGTEVAVYLPREKGLE